MHCVPPVGSSESGLSLQASHVPICSPEWNKKKIAEIRKVGFEGIGSMPLLNGTFCTGFAKLPTYATAVSSSCEVMPGTYC